MIQIKNLKIAYGARILIQNAQAQIHPGQRIGLVGKNGCGKSTLFALLRQEKLPEQGELEIPTHWQIASVRQDTPALTTSALDYVLDGHLEFRKAQQKINTLESDGIALSKAYEHFEQIGGYRLPAQAGELLSGLGFKIEEHQQSVASFSGGWRMRLNLAQALISPADLLLLDEPTNHLDLDAILWLQDFLKQHSATQIIIAHDREFLDALCENIWHIENTKLETYRGNYSQFEKLRYEKRQQAQAEQQKTDAKRAHLLNYIERFRAKASKAKQAQSRLKALEKLESAPPIDEQNAINLTFQASLKQPQTPLTLKNIAHDYQNTPILKNITLQLLNQTRIGLLGKNGAGKSTLMKILAGTLKAKTGERIIHPHCQIGYFQQHALDHLEENATPLSEIKKILPKESEQNLRNILGAYGFSDERVFSKISSFSGGEKARLALALIIAERPNLLLLDEPTNHLDIEMRKSLSLALQQYDGALLIISHDRELLRNSCDEFYLIDKQQLRPFDGDLDDYHQQLKKEKSKPQTPNTLNQKQKDAQKRIQLRPYKQALEKAEKALIEIEEALFEIENKLSEEALYQETRKEELKQTLNRQSALKKALEKAEENWQQASDALSAQI